MTKAVRVLSFALPLAFAALSVAHKPNVVGSFSISSYGLV